jgi:hypothetical protein
MSLDDDATLCRTQPTQQQTNPSTYTMSSQATAVQPETPHTMHTSTNT